MSSMPMVTFVVTTWLPENKKYLDLCIQSIFNIDYPKEQMDVIIVGKPGYLPEYPGCRTVAPDKTKFYCTEGANFGASHAHPDSKYIMLLNDDVVLSKQSIGKMVGAADSYKDQICLNPICNSDNTLHYRLMFYMKSTDSLMSPGGVDYENMKPYFDDMMNTGSVYPSGLLFSDFLPLSSTLIPIKIWKELNGLDEGFRGGADDVDFCYRVKDAGYIIAHLLDAVAWHFGSVTIKKTVSPDNWLYNTEYFLKKWGRYPGKNQKDLHAKVRDEYAKLNYPEEITKNWV